MLISVRQLGRYWAVHPNGVLHVGAHEAEELTDYQAAGWSPVVWVEALPDKAAQLQERFRGTVDQTAISALAWDADGESLTLWRANNGQSSSALPMGTHLVEHPEVRVVEDLSIQSSRLDTLLQGTAHRFEFINLDIQGAELRALRGLGDRIREVRWIYCEVNEKPLYVGAHLMSEIDAYLTPFGFRRVDTDMTPHGWGDAL
jgi:FkbM family methyltransferase